MDTLRDIGLCIMYYLGFTVVWCAGTAVLLFLLDHPPLLITAIVGTWWWNSID